MVNALTFTLFLLRADTSADGGQCTCFLECFRGSHDVPTFQVFDEGRNVNAHGATLHTSRVGTVQATFSLLACHFQRQSLIHLLRELSCSFLRVGSRHHHSFDAHSFFGFHRLSERFSPFRVASLLLVLFGAVVFLFHGIAFFRFESPETFQHLVKVHLVTIELRSIHADKFRFSAHGDAAGATHTRSVHHDGVERDVGRDFIFLSQQTDEFHHDGRSDGETFVHLFPFDDLLHAFRDESFFAVTSVVGHDDDLVAHLSQFLFQDDEAFVACGEHGDDPVTRSVQSLCDGQERCGSHAPCCTDHGSELIDVSRFSERSGDVCDLFAFVESAQFFGGDPDALHDECDATFFFVGGSDGERDSFSSLAGSDDDEVTCFSGACNQWSFHFHAEDIFRELCFA